LIAFARSAREPGGATGEHLEIDRLVERLASSVHAQDRLAALEVGPVDHDLTVEPSGPQQRRVEDVGPVRGRHQDHRGPLIEAVHLDQQLVQRLLALVVPAAEAGTALAAYGVDLVDKHDRRSARLRLFEQVPHARRADAHEHLHEVRARDREERHACLAGHRARQQRLAGAGRAEEQHPSRDLRPHRLELRRVLQVVLDLLQLLDRFVDAGHVAERGLRLILGDGLVLAAPELHHAAAAPLGPVQHEQQDAADQQHGEDHRDQRAQQRVRLLRIDLGRDAGCLQQRGQIVGVLRRVRGAVCAAVGELTGDRLLAVMDHRVGDPTALDLGLELGQADLVALGPAAHEGDDEEEDERAHHDPERGRAGDLLQRRLGLLVQRALLVGEVTSGPRVGAVGPVRPMVAPASDEEDPRFPGQRMPVSTTSVTSVKVSTSTSTASGETVGGRPPPVTGSTS